MKSFILSSNMLYSKGNNISFQFGTLYSYICKNVKSNCENKIWKDIHLTIRNIIFPIRRSNH